MDAVAAHTSAILTFWHARQSLRCNAINAYGLVRLGRSDARNYVWRSWWARLILALHPAITIVTIVATANHYVVDAIGGCVYFLLAWLFVTILNRALLGNVRTTGEMS